MPRQQPEETAKFITLSKECLYFSLFSSIIVVLVYFLNLFFLFFSSCNWLRCFLTPWCLIMMDIFLLNKCFYLCNCWAFIWDWKAKINWEVASWTCTFHPSVYMLRNDQIWNTVICKIHKIFTPDFYLQLQIVFIGPQKSSLFCFWTLLTQILKKEHGSSRDFLNPQGLS